MKKIKLLFVLLTFYSYVFASSCTDEQKAQMIINGITQATIDKMCTTATTSQPESVTQQAGPTIINIYQTQTNNQTQQQQQTVTAAPILAEETVESWYLLFGYGSVNISYPDSINTINDYMGSNVFSGVADFGVYLAATKNLMIGWVFNSYHSDFNNYDESDYYNSLSASYTVNTSSFSSVYYPDILGKGLFFRGDIGTSALSMSTYIDTYDIDTQTYDYNYDYLDTDGGLGVLIGVGYAFRLIGTSVQVGVNYTLNDLGNNISMSSLQFMGSVLF